MNSNWLWQLPVFAGILLLSASYWRGRRALLRHQDGIRPSRLSTTSFIMFLTSVICLAGALFTPLNELAFELFVFHVAQHLLVAAVVPAFFWFSDPPASYQGGLPGRSAAIYHHPSKAWPAPVRANQKGHPKGVAWILFVTVVWFWYDAIVHEATLTRPWLHFLEITTVYLAANLYWWHITGAAPANA